MDNKSFRSFKFESGLLYDDGLSTLYGIKHGAQLSFRQGTYYAFVHQGYATVNHQWTLSAGMYGSFTSGYIEPGIGSQVMVVRHRYTRGVFMIGGPVERTGRLRYIDGCTDSLLVPPVKKGDPCLNHLHFPPNIRQTMHTHPSVRIGLVKGGKGECITPFGNVPLEPGMLFAILPEDGEKAIGLDGRQHPVGSHCFFTHNSPMDVIAFHPDSDFGPTDEEHPMINRTFVDGVSASKIVSIRTK